MGLLLSWVGRIGRGKFWLGQLLIAAILMAMYAISFSFMDFSFNDIIEQAAREAEAGGEPVDVAALRSIMIGSMIFGVVIGLLFALGQPAMMFLMSLIYMVAAIFFGDHYAELMRAAMEAQPAGSPATIPEWMLSPTYLIVSGLISLAFSWIIMAVSIKRAHDRGQSGWWLLLTLIPVIGMIWWLVNLGILEGETGPNRYGPDPTMA